MENGVKYQFLMSQLTHMQDIKETEKTKLSVVFYALIQAPCILRVCKGRDLSSVCEALRKIRNPNAVVVYDYVYENGDTYILEESISGSSIEQLLEKDGVFSEKETARIIIDVCKALEDLHGEAPPVVHNDINPSNIMLREDGSVKLFDFDISRLYKKGASQNTVLFGTEEYASPEHFGYGQSEPRTDIYCLGVTMHKMLTGAGLTPEHRITYKGKLKKILGKCLAFDPEKRYGSVRVLRKELEESLNRGMCWFRYGFCIAAVILFAVLLFNLFGKENDQPENLLQASSSSETGTIIETDDTQCVDTTTQLPEGTVQFPGETTQPSTATTPLPGETVQKPGTTTPLPSETTQPTSETTKPSVETTQPLDDAESTVPQDNHSAEYAAPILLGQAYTETIEKDGVADWYRFYTTSNKAVYRFFVDSNVGESPVNGKTKLALYDKDGKKQKEITVDYRKSGFFDILLEPNAEYTVKLYAEHTVPATGDYLLCVSERICDAGTDQESAFKLTLSAEYTAVANDTLGDWYVFTVEAPGKYEITLCNLNVGAKLSISGERNGGSVFSGWVYHEDSASRTFNAAAGDVIYIKVKTDDPAADGEYTVVIEPQ